MQPSASSPPSSATLSGTVTVPRDGVDSGGPNVILSTVCTAAAGYEDVHDGAQVVVLDAEGTILAVGELEYGRPGSGLDCQFKFSVEEVPKGKGFYSIDVGNAFRGVVTIRESDLGVYQRLSIG